MFYISTAARGEAFKLAGIGDLYVYYMIAQVFDQSNAFYSLHAAVPFIHLFMPFLFLIFTGELPPIPLFFGTYLVKTEPSTWEFT